MRRPRGFTLVEALLSATLMLLLLGQLALVQRGARQALERGRTAGAGPSQLGQARARFTRDCLDFVLPGSVTLQGAPAIEMLHHVGASTTARLRFFVAQTSPRALRDLRKITYTLEDGGLVRLDDPPGPRAVHRPSVRDMLVPQVGDLEFMLFDGVRWVRAWTDPNRAPLGLSIRFSDGAGASHHWRKLFGGLPTP